MKNNGLEWDRIDSAMKFGKLIRNKQMSHQTKMYSARNILIEITNAIEHKTTMH